MAKMLRVVVDGKGRHIIDRRKLANAGKKYRKPRHDPDENYSDESGEDDSESLANAGEIYDGESNEDESDDNVSYEYDSD